MTQLESTLLEGREKTLDSATAVLSGIVKALVNFPEDVRVSRKAADEGTVMVLELRDEDIKRFTSNNLRTATSLRAMMSAVAVQNTNLTQLDIRAARS